MRKILLTTIFLAGLILAFLGGDRLAAQSCSAFGLCGKNCGAYWDAQGDIPGRCDDNYSCVVKLCDVNPYCSGSCQGTCTGASNNYWYTDYCENLSPVTCPCGDP